MANNVLGPRIERAIGWLVLRRVRAGHAARRSYAEHRLVLNAALTVLMAVATARGAAAAQPWAELYFSDPSAASALSALLVGLGCALVGATALVFTLILFAMQVNVGRMPSALFMRLSRDSRLLAAFIGTFLLSLGVASLSVPHKPGLSIWQVWLATWATCIVVTTFLFAYKRAIALTNPAEQVEIVAREAAADLQRWGRLADRVTPLMGEAPKEDAAPDPRRITFLNGNVGWDQKAKRLSGQIVAYGSRLAEQGDHDSFRTMLQGMVRIHAAYVETKRAAFTNSHPFFDIPESRDSFLLSTLEQLRITAQAAAARKDEQQCIDCFRAFTDLFRVYNSIKYSANALHKYHANLVSGYLQSQVQAAAMHKMPDVTMEGVRQIGVVAKINLVTQMASEVQTPVNKIGLLSALGIVDQAHLPVTQAALEQLAELTLLAIPTRLPRHPNPFEVIRSAAFGGASNIVQGVQEVSAISAVHRSYLAPYFSTADAGALLPRLREMANVVLGGQAGGKEGQVIDGFLGWSDGLHRELKELLLLSFRVKSSLSFDLLTWPCVAVELLLALRQSGRCDGHQSERLNANARAVAAVLSWVPVDSEGIRTAEACSFQEKLFESALSSHQRGSDEVFTSIKNTLLRWSVSASGEEGWGTLGEGLKLLSVLAVRLEGQGGEAKLIQEVRAELGRRGGWPRETLGRAANDLRAEAREHRGRGYAMRMSEAVLEELDQEALAHVMNAVADELVGAPLA